MGKPRSQRLFPYPVIRNAIIIIITVTGITNPILIIVLLPRVRQIRAVILQRKKYTEMFTPGIITIWI